MKKYKFVYYEGNSIDLKTKVTGSKGFFAEEDFVLDEINNIRIPYKDINNVELFRLHGLGRMIRLNANNHNTIFLTVVRLNIANSFLIINFLATGKVSKFLSTKANSSLTKQQGNPNAGT
jgi:hypothetical protein